MRLLNRSVNGWAGRISRHRRGPLAGLMVLVLGLLFTGGLYAAFAPAQAQQGSSSAEQVAKGRQLFLVGCAFCHGQNGEGIRTQNGKQIGPTLVGVGAAAVDFQVGTGRMPLSGPMVQAPQKEVQFSQPQIDAMAAYIASLRAQASVAQNLANADTPNYKAVDIELIKNRVMRGLSTPSALMIAPQLFKLSGDFTRPKLDVDGAKKLAREMDAEAGEECPGPGFGRGRDDLAQGRAERPAQRGWRVAADRHRHVDRLLIV